MLYDTNLENIVFRSTASNTANSLIVISGYVGSKMVEQVKNYQDKKFFVIYGMYGMESISDVLHKQLVTLDNKYPNLEIYYSNVPIHSKIYCWCDSNKVTQPSIIAEALIGSANFSVNGLRVDHKETLHPVDPNSYKEYWDYLDYVIKRSVRCTDSSISTKKQKKAGIKIKSQQPLFAYGICRMTLLDRNGQVPQKSGLNWGSANAHTSINDAYIGIKSEHINCFPNLFPGKKYINGVVNNTSSGKQQRQNDEIELIWDDNNSMVGLMEGTLSVNNVLYPNKICSSINKHELGDYLRKRIATVLSKKGYTAEANQILLPNSIITVSMLNHYGRTHIDMSLIGPGIYYMDFSV